MLAKQRGKSLILVDGAPGVGCPVISSITGADHVVIVTEPSLSGMHDMDRALKLVQGFGISASVVINKADINPDVTKKIGELSENPALVFSGLIPYDPMVIKSLVQRLCVMESQKGPAAEAIASVWESLNKAVIQ